MTMFATLQSDGTLTSQRNIRQSDILACPHVILMPSHYRADGSCKCSDFTERAMMIREWGYTRKDFKGIPLREV